MLCVNLRLLSDLGPWGDNMRAIIPIDLALPLGDREPGLSVDGILQTRGWRLPEETAQAAEVQSSTTLDWNRLVNNMSPVHPEKAVQEASRLTHLAEEELEKSSPTSARRFSARQHEAVVNQAGTLLTEQIKTQAIANGQEDNRLSFEGKKLSEFQSTAARQARLIIDQISEEDQPYALIAFMYPIFERETETWGTVHYESLQRHVVIRLRNPNSEKLKTASEHLVKSFLSELRPKEKTLRFKIFFEKLGGLVQTTLYRIPKQDGPFTFLRIRVLEANSTMEAYSGDVQPARGFRWTLKQRKTDIGVAVVFLILGFSVLLLESPLALNLDTRLHSLTHWTDGWLSWYAGNIQRMGSALFVAIFLPVIQVFLFWRATKSKPYINWSVTERS
jgi:hypothetical protein